MYGPVIEGKLVRLRPPRQEDGPLMITWFEDTEVTRFLGHRFPSSLEQEKEWLESRAKDPDAIVWVVEHEGRAVGSTGIHAINWRDGHGTTGTAIGERTVWRKGLASELMQLRARYAFTSLPLRKLKSAYFEGNVGSARAQAACGYKEVGRWHEETFIDGQWRDMVLTELLRSDWEATQPR